MSKALKVLITGPESTGKSYLSEFLAQHFNSTWVREYAREYLERLDRPYQKEDLNDILRGQLLRESIVVDSNAYDIVFCDTGPEVVYIWSEHKYNHVAPEIIEAFEKSAYDLILLLDVDLPWEDDPLREAPDYQVRRSLFMRYLTLLNQREQAVTIIRGDHQERKRKAADAVNNLLASIK